MECSRNHKNGALRVCNERSILLGASGILSKACDMVTLRVLFFFLFFSFLSFFFFFNYFFFFALLLLFVLFVCFVLFV